NLAVTRYSRSESSTGCVTSSASRYRCARYSRPPGLVSLPRWSTNASNRQRRLRFPNSPRSSSMSDLITPGTPLTASTASEAPRALRARGTRLELAGDRLRAYAAPGVLDGETLDILREHKPAL